MRQVLDHTRCGLVWILCLSLTGAGCASTPQTSAPIDIDTRSTIEGAQLHVIYADPQLDVFNARSDGLAVGSGIATASGAGAIGANAALAPTLIVIGIFTAVGLAFYLYTKAVDKSKTKQLQSCIGRDEMNHIVMATTDLALSKQKKYTLNRQVGALKVAIDDEIPDSQVLSWMPKKRGRVLNKDTSHDVVLLYSAGFKALYPFGDPSAEYTGRLFVIDREKNKVVFRDHFSTASGFERTVPISGLLENNCEQAKHQLAQASTYFADRLICDRLGITNCFSVTLRNEISDWADY